MMNTTEVRAAVTAYQRVQALLREPLSQEARAPLSDYACWAEEACSVITTGSAPSRWAKSMVGPVLAAGMGAAAWMRDDVPTAGGALRIFGLSGERALSSAAAWNLMQAYVWEPVISPAALNEIRRRSRLRLAKLPAEPSPIDVLEELTRPHSSAFASQMSHWLADYFRSHALDDTPYAAYYCGAAGDMAALNDRGELASMTGASLSSGRLSRDEWDALIRGRVPQPRIDMRAAYFTVKKFVADYWEKWQESRHILATG